MAEYDYSKAYPKKIPGGIAAYRASGAPDLDTYLSGLRSGSPVTSPLVETAQGHKTAALQQMDELLGRRVAGYEGDLNALDARSRANATAPINLKPASTTALETKSAAIPGQPVPVGGTVAAQNTPAIKAGPAAAYPPGATQPIIVAPDSAAERAAESVKTSAFLPGGTLYNTPQVRLPQPGQNRERVNNLFSVRDYLNQQQ